MLDEITEQQRQNEESDVNDSKDRKRKRETVQDVIDALKNFPQKKQFLSKMKFESMGIDDIETQCHEYINDTIRIPEDKVKDVFDDFLVEAVKDFKDCAKIGSPIIYTYEQQKKDSKEFFPIIVRPHLIFITSFKNIKRNFLIWCV